MKRGPSPRKRKSKTKRPPKPKPPRLGFKPIHDGGYGGTGGSGTGGSGKGGGTPPTSTPDVAIDISFSTDPSAFAQKLTSMGFTTDITPNFGGLGFFLLRIGLWAASSAAPPRRQNQGPKAYEPRCHRSQHNAHFRRHD